MSQSRSLRKNRLIVPKRKLVTHSTAEPICQYSSARKHSRLTSPARKYQRLDRGGSARLIVPVNDAGTAFTVRSMLSERQLTHNSNPARFSVRSTTPIGP